MPRQRAWRVHRKQYKSALHIWPDTIKPTQKYHLSGTVLAKIWKFSNTCHWLLGKQIGSSSCPGGERWRHPINSHQKYKRIYTLEQYLCWDSVPNIHSYSLKHIHTHSHPHMRYFEWHRNSKRLKPKLAFICGRALVKETIVHVYKGLQSRSERWKIIFINMARAVYMLCYFLYQEGWW